MGELIAALDENQFAAVIGAAGLVFGALITGLVNVLVVHLEHRRAERQFLNEKLEELAGCGYKTMEWLNLYHENATGEEGSRDRKFLAEVCPYPGRALLLATLYSSENIDVARCMFSTVSEFQILLDSHQNPRLQADYAQQVEAVGKSAAEFNTGLNLSVRREKQNNQTLL